MAGIVKLGPVPGCASLAGQYRRSTADVDGLQVITTSRYPLCGITPPTRNTSVHPISADRDVIEEYPQPGPDTPGLGCGAPPVRPERSSRRLRSAPGSPIATAPRSPRSWARTETVASASSRSPTTSMNGTFASSASRILRPTDSERSSTAHPDAALARARPATSPRVVEVRGRRPAGRSPGPAPARSGSGRRGARSGSRRSAPSSRAARGGSSPAGARRCPRPGRRARSAPASGSRPGRCRSCHERPSASVTWKSIFGP